MDDTSIDLLEKIKSQAFESIQCKCCISARWILLYTADYLQCDVMDVVELTTALYSPGFSYQFHHCLMKLRPLEYMRVTGAKAKYE